MLDLIHAKVFDALNKALSPPHNKSFNVYMSIGVCQDETDIGEWGLCYRRECSKNNKKPAIDIYHAFIYPEYRMKGAMTQFIMSLAQWCTSKGVDVRVIYMTQDMVDHNAELRSFWDAFEKKGNVVIKDGLQVAYSW